MIENLKKIELHLHLDGSVKVETVESLLGKTNLKEEMIATNTQSLTDYIQKFNLPIQVMQTKEILTRVSKELIEDLKKDHVIYAEIRFAPNLHTKEGLTLDEIIESVLEGLQNKDIKTNLILCMMRGASFEENKAVIEITQKYFNHGVCAIDLAGDEKKYPTSLYKELFEYAKECNIPYTIHAGEAGTINDLRDAICYGTKRIGHGIKAINDEQIMNELVKKNITLEICPTSNLQTHNIKTYESHPIKQLKEKNVLVTINTDNRTVSNITLNEEYHRLQETFHFTKKDFEEMNINAIHASFLTEEEKEKLLYEITQ